KDGESYTFNFDLFAGNFPVILPQSQKESIGMDSAITVVVTSGIVNSYKRFAVNFVPSYVPLSAGTKFSEAYIDANGALPENALITKVDLVYYADSESLVSGTLKLAWFFETQYSDGTVTESLSPAK
ncbi:MAG: hypothetical protein LBM16_01810, partial [Clostridiales bacterium]|nr:hypothetical protein [Clostridiales bacterium]